MKIVFKGDFIKPGSEFESMIQHMSICNTFESISVVLYDIGLDLQILLDTEKNLSGTGISMKTLILQQ